MFDHNPPWRFAVADDGTITRGRTYCVGDSDSWTYYWDGDSQIAFYDEGFTGHRVVTGTDTEAGERAIRAHRAEQDGSTRDAMTRVAKRITGNPDAHFICVGLDRGIDLYALSWDGDPDGEWASEIEAVWNHEVYRVETETFLPYIGEHGAWLTADDTCEEFYGEDKAAEGLAKMFPLDAAPSEFHTAC